MNILVLGSGGREHALVWKLAQSGMCQELYCAPGNAGIAVQATCLELASQAETLAFCQDKKIGLVVIGPEQPLVEGMADTLRAAGINVFGPDGEAAELEGSKSFAKEIMMQAGVPTAAYGLFNDIDSAKDFVREQGAPIVIKADGLAAGKGVVVAETLDQALEAVDSLLADGGQLVIESFLKGEEASYFALIDGKTVVGFGSAQDHKRVGEGDTGPNTGGMGAYSPAPIITPELEQRILTEIAQPIADEMVGRMIPFRGVLFIGLMIDQGEPSVLEFNVRFGDPECQVLMMRLEDDLAKILHAAATGKLAQVKPQWSDDTALTVVMASEGYPGSYEKGSVIKGADQTDAQVFHAGTKRNEAGELTAVGGRVLAVTGKAGTVAQAQAKAYAGVDAIDWPQGFCRRDIGWRAV